MCFGLFQVLDTGNSSSDQFPDRDDTDLFKLLHLQRRVVPYSSSKAPRQFQGIPYCNGVLKADLAVYNAANQPDDVGKNKSFILLKGELMFLELFVIREIHRTQLGLNEQRDLMSWCCYIDFNRESDVVGSIDLFVQ